MKVSPQEQKITQRMAPGVLCRDGFLGTDRRSLGEILDADRSTLVGLGVPAGRIAQRLGEITSAAMVAYGTPVKVGEGLVASYRESMGRIPSPWGDGVFPKGEIELTHSPSGRAVRFTPLSVHLIDKHGFFQGRGSRYRLEPDELVEILDIEPTEQQGQ